MMESKEKSRRAVLIKIYEHASGKGRFEVPFAEVAKECGLAEEETDEICDYLEGEGLIELMAFGPMVALTHRGIVEVEKGISKQDRLTESQPQIVQHYYGSVGAVQNAEKSRAFINQGSGREGDQLDKNLIDLLLRISRGEQFFRPENESDEAKDAFVPVVRRLKELSQRGLIEPLTDRRIIKDNAPHSTANVTEVRPEESVESLYDFALLDSMVKRDDLVFDLRARLSLKNLLVLKGSSGMGKSTLAILLASKDGGRWKRLDFRDVAPEQLKERLIRATVEEAEEGGDFNYIVDDLNFDNRPATYERALAGFLHSITSRGGRVVITTQGDLPSLIKLSFDLPPESISSTLSL
jgi:hypothetical protein